MKSQRLSRTHAKHLKDRVKKIEPKVREWFDKSCRAWREDWDHKILCVSSNPHHRTHTRSFLELVALGPDIIPLLMEKLTHPDEFFALQALDRLLKPEMVVRFRPTEPAALLGEQYRAFETVRRWIRRVA